MENNTSPDKRIQENKIKKEHEYYIESEAPLGEALSQKLQKIKALREKGVDLYRSRFEKNTSIADIRQKYSTLKAGEHPGEIFRLAGRMLIFRKHGKATFCDIKDSSGKIQLYINLKKVGEDAYNEFLDLDIGDWVGIEGAVFITRSGELSVEIFKFELLSKAIRILPEKWHGLTDKELRYRQRYLDLTVNPETRDVFLARIRVMSSLRKFLTDKGFLEVETPMLHPIPGGAAARPFITHHNALDIDLYLRIAPELYLKRLIIGGFEKVFELNRNFRNEGISYKHNPEFTMLEFYQAFVDYNDLMDLTEELIKFVALEVTGRLDLEYRGEKIDLGKGWNRYTMLEAIEEVGKIKVDLDTSMEELVKIAGGLDIGIADDLSKGKIINKIFEATVEHKLIQPTFIKDYPIDISPLAKKHPDNENLTERFELFIGGEEIANAFSELIDPCDQLERLKNRQRARMKKREKLEK